MNRRKFLGVTGAILASGYSSFSSAQVVNINDAINKSGRQRMLSQRLAKGYVQIGMSVDPERSKKIFETSLELFERQLIELKAFSPSADNRETLKEMDNTWTRYKGILVGKAPNQVDAKTIMVINEDLLALAQKSTVQLESLATTSSGKLVNMAGRQRMLSQRMAKFYQAMNWAVAPPDAVKKLVSARQEFITSLAELVAAPQNTPQIKRELELAQHQWLFFDNALNNPAGSTNKHQLTTNVAMSSERILEVMDRITGFYQAMA